MVFSGDECGNYLKFSIGTLFKELCYFRIAKLRPIYKIDIGKLGIPVVLYTALYTFYFKSLDGTAKVENTDTSFNNSMETTTLRHMFFQRKPRDAEPIRVEILHFGTYNFDVIRFLTSCALAQ